MRKNERGCSQKVGYCRRQSYNSSPNRVQKDAVFVLHHGEMEYPRSVWSLRCVEFCMPLLTETCGFLPSPEAARVAWAWAPTPLLFCPLKSQSWLEKVFTSVFWQRHSLSHWGHLGKWTPSAADSYSTPAWVHAGTSHVVCIDTSGRYQTSARCPIAQGYRLRKLEGWLYSALGWGCAVIGILMPLQSTATLRRHALWGLSCYGKI